MTVGKRPADPTPTDTSPETPVVVPNVSKYLPPFLQGPIRAVELYLIEGEITKVHSLLQDQITALGKITFEDDAAIPVASFGRGAESYQLASEHRRAHGVIVKSLEELLTEITAYQTAILDAKALITGVDEQADTDLRIFLARADDLDLGSDDPYQDPTPSTQEEGL